MINSVGILGAGKLGLVLAQLSVRAGLQVTIAGSRKPSEIALTVGILAPGTRAVTADEVIKESDVVILALPLGKYKTLPRERFENKLVIDAMNYWWEVDGITGEFDDPTSSTTEMIQDYLRTDRVYKAFNHIGYHDLLDSSSDLRGLKRKAVAYAGKNDSDKHRIEWLIDALGFEPVYIGGLSKGILLQPGSNIFGANVNKKALLKLIKEFPESNLGIRILSNSKNNS